MMMPRPTTSEEFRRICRIFLAFFPTPSNTLCSKPPSTAWTMSVHTLAEAEERGRPIFLVDLPTPRLAALFFPTNTMILNMYAVTLIASTVFASPPPPFISHSSSRRTLTKSSSSFERPASHKTSGQTKTTSSPSSTKSLLCSHLYLFRHTYYTSLLTVISFPILITPKRVAPSSLASA